MDVIAIYSGFYNFRSWTTCRHRLCEFCILGMTDGKGYPGDEENIYVCEADNGLGGQCEANIDLRTPCETINFFRDPKYVNYMDLDYATFDYSVIDSDEIESLQATNPRIYDKLKRQATDIPEFDLFLLNGGDESEPRPTQTRESSIENIIISKTNAENGCDKDVILEPVTFEDMAPGNSAQVVSIYKFSLMYFYFNYAFMVKLVFSLFAWA